MGRQVKDTSLQSRESRRALKQRDEPYWRAISEGLHIGYRKGSRGGVWRVRLFQDGKYLKRSLGVADDVLDADAVKVLTWRQAQEAAQEFDRDTKANNGIIRGPLTVQAATDRYLEWLKAHRKASTYVVVTSFLNAHILPTFADWEISSLTSDDLQKWLHKLAIKPGRLRTSRDAKKQSYRDKPSTDDEKRARKATANRVLTIFKALLNKAFNDNLVGSDTAWRRVRPFANTDPGTIRYLSPEECTRLVNAAPANLKMLVRGALYTGGRFGELARMTVGDVDVANGRVFISAAAKSSKSRYVPLSPEAKKFFGDLVAGRDGAECLFKKADGSHWGARHYGREFFQANIDAKISPPIRFHDLRHTYATMFANLRGNSIDVLAEILGHADTRITTRHYAFLFDDTKKRAVAKMPGLGYTPEHNVRGLTPRAA